MIPCAYPKAQYLPHKEEIDTAIQNVLNSGNYILGEEVSKFEREFADHLDIEYAVGCGSGTDALVLSMRALDIGSGDEVIVPSHTAVATVAAVVMAGASPVYVDIEPDFFTIDPDKVDAACSDKTKAIIAVHIYGQSAALDTVLKIAGKRNLRVIEDCAQATGASFHNKKLGTIGDIGCFSFFPTKNMGAFGDGGAIACHDKTLAARIRGLRQYGWDENRISLEPGTNSRLDELQAAILRVKLRYLDEDNAERKKQANWYIAELSDLPITLPATRNDASHVYHLFVIQSEDRDALLQHLKQNDIAAGIHYMVPVHMMPAFKGNAHLLNTERIVNRIISLPLFPGMDEAAQNKVISAIRSFYG